MVGQASRPVQFLGSLYSHPRRGTRQKAHLTRRRGDTEENAEKTKSEQCDCRETTNLVSSLCVLRFCLLRGFLRGLRASASKRLPRFWHSHTAARAAAGREPRLYKMRRTSGS